MLSFILNFNSNSEYTENGEPRRLLEFESAREFEGVFHQKMLAFFRPFFSPYHLLSLLCGNEPEHLEVIMIPLWQEQTQETMREMLLLLPWQMLITQPTALADDWMAHIRKMSFWNVFLWPKGGIEILRIKLLIFLKIWAFHLFKYVNSTEIFVSFRKTEWQERRIDENLPRNWSQ